MTDLLHPRIRWDMDARTEGDKNIVAMNFGKYWPA